MIIETNFRVYCYTNEALDKEILRLFCHMDTIFPNFIGGTLTRENCREAFKKGIKARQIEMFLSKRAHEQMYIKKDLEEEKDDPAGILVDSKEQLDERRRSKVNKEYDAKASVLPKNVIQQIYIWEEEMNSYTAQDSLLVRPFENKQKLEYFLQFLQSASIPCLAKRESPTM